MDQILKTIYIDGLKKKIFKYVKYTYQHPLTHH